MTREEAKEFIAQSVKSDVDMALVADAIKVLEQEPVIDKIYDEVSHLVFRPYEGRDTLDRKDVLQIIDKYKSESEK